MTQWLDRTIEERHLLNPAFCGVVLWSIARGYEKERANQTDSKTQLPLVLAFVGASLVLRGRTRSNLPRIIATSLPAWLHDHPLERSAIAQSIAHLRPYIREALIFAAQHKLLTLTNARDIQADAHFEKSISVFAKKATEDVTECVTKATFVGRWLARGGSPSTILDLVGVAP